jgi:catechol-2,3-dioxygenase
MAPIARMRAVVLDCPDPRALAGFYRELVGGDITYADDEWVSLRDGAAVLLSFQRVPDYRPPVWPTGDPPQQFHLDVTVTDVEDAEARVLGIGATKHAVQPGEAEQDGNFRVYLDPAGHPFCFCWD